MAAASVRVIWEVISYMPKAMEKALKKEAKKKGLTGDRADAFVYGTMRKTGWKPNREK
jgi:hypothetical protein